MCAIEVGKEGAAARFFPADGIAERAEVDLGDAQVAFVGEMLCQRAFELVGGRQVDIAVGDVDRRAAKYALALELGPLLGGQYLEGGGGGHSPPVLPVAVSASVTAVPSADRTRLGLGK